MTAERKAAAVRPFRIDIAAVRSRGPGRSTRLAWNLQLFGDDVTDDCVITNVMMYWLTNTAGT